MDVCDYEPLAKMHTYVYRERVRKKSTIHHTEMCTPSFNQDYAIDSHMTAACSHVSSDRWLQR